MIRIENALTEDGCTEALVGPPKDTRARSAQQQAEGYIPMKQFDERPSPYGTVTVVSLPQRTGKIILVPDATMKKRTWEQPEPGLAFMHPDSIEELKACLAFDEWMTRVERQMSVRAELDVTTIITCC